MIKGVTDLGPIWYHSEPSEVPYSLNQKLVRYFFFVHTIQKSGSSNAFTYESLLLHQQDVLKTQSQEGYVLKYFSSKIRYATIYQPQLFEFSYPRPYSQMQCGVIGEASKYGTHTHIYI